MIYHVPNIKNEYLPAYRNMINHAPTRETSLHCARFAISCTLRLA
ncbi:hypothetical protein HMPREF0653_02275 [Prevotella disiens JCM 6334 = ATCC 29426]|uniref:Uncharacterized protein n=1 Tax=Prevotella disiens JCM 6334 = ATCC 29426 TaxID=1235811 RepID=A0ABP2Y4Q9_9BACT|nr:hypothetical protein HMPREF0653_02275 [Prevotella disiens JCM 6334 = ATCC 29426]